MSNKLLPIFLRSVVVKGFGRGSKSLGTPTANISEEQINCVPKELDFGIYYGWAALDGVIYKMVMSFGWNPFFKNEKKSLEVHILHQFDDDFYGKELRIAITGYIRPEKDFKSIDELIKEIKNDIRIASERLDDPEMIKYKGNDIFK